MTRGKRNWTFRQVQTFLQAHGFFLHHIRGSHHYFRGAYNGKLRMAHVQYHGAGSYTPKLSVQSSSNREYPRTSGQRNALLTPPCGGLDFMQKPLFFNACVWKTAV